MLKKSIRKAPDKLLAQFIGAPSCGCAICNPKQVKAFYHTIHMRARETKKYVDLSENAGRKGK